MPGYKPQVKTNSGMVDVPIAATYDENGDNIVATYAKKGDVTINLNGADVNNPSLYAPTAAGTTGQVLISQGEGKAPVWVNKPADIANASVTLGASLTFNGSAQEQTIASVTLGGTSLSEGTDYKVEGNIATDAGNYTMAIMGIGDYSGTLFVEWTIAPAQGSISVPASVDVLGTKQITVNVTSGYGDLVATSSAPNIATASLLGNTLTITSVADGNATITVRLIGNYSAEESIAANVTFVSSVLNDNTWGVVRLVADNDLGENFWAIGDTKAIPLNGTVGTKSYSNVTVWAYILGFNHNVSVDGKHLIHFSCFKTAQADGVDVALDDSHYQSFSKDGEKWFNMNHSSDTNSGGWKDCDLRYDILGSTDVNNGNPTSTCATSPVANTLMAAFPADLRAVMKPATKYTNNTGNSSSAGSVTATQDYLPLLAEFEVQGVRTYANEYEQNYQEQYVYYANGNSKVKHRQSLTGSEAYWFCRSPRWNNNNTFCDVAIDGSASSARAFSSYGVSPIFFV